MKYMILVLSIICVLGYACSDDNDEKEIPVIHPEAEGTWVNPQDGNTYHWVRYGNQDWLCENMRTETAPGTFFKDEKYITEENLSKYGYVYTFEGANSLAVEEWRLPTDEDWKALEHHLGMSRQDCDAEEWRGDFEGQLMMQGNTGSGLGLTCSGYYYTTGGSGVRNFMVDGIYWTSTLDSRTSGYAWTRMISYNRSDIRRFSMMTAKGLSVRLVRDVK
ncbi:fibrobacter succinogenes major paralogous domain-containing protein [Butyricimonas hominis]|uniref:Fibrobacter succinogenes major paralogous domain-containing protein n=1 Tax=Butyricimonas hominis TaxID=2763032 RepID=A0ABR7CW54_9BACT|nr:fibrobacter succinogenes major paralogous domain-containing protein [Butyricimonas hominis]MBC5619874.1 fibrobacter succinogenes major paralogous domain-containing protein [Butyricimonas hominis]